VMQNALRLAALVALVLNVEVECGHVPPPSTVVRWHRDDTQYPSLSGSSEVALPSIPPQFQTLMACRGGSAATPPSAPSSSAAAPSPTPGPPPASWASTGFMRPSKRIDDQGFLREVIALIREV